MALIKCEGCGKKISDKALICPKCGWSKEDSEKEMSENTNTITETVDNGVDNLNDEKYKTIGITEIIIILVIFAIIAATIYAVISSL